MSIVSVLLFVLIGIVFSDLIVLYFNPDCENVYCVCTLCSSGSSLCVCIVLYYPNHRLCRDCFFLSPLNKRIIPWRQPSNVYCIWSSKIGSVCWSEIHETNEMPKGVNMCFLFLYMKSYLQPNILIFCVPYTILFI